MDEDGDDKDDTKRRTRNLSEKKRRDQFNMLVNELGEMVSSSSRKMDKSSVLKSTISFLKNHNEVTIRSRAHDIQEDWKPPFLANEEFTYLMLEALEGFVMVFSTTGRIYYVSEGITSLLGHTPSDVLNKTIIDLTFENDRPSLYNLLQNPGTPVDPNEATTADKEIKFQYHLKRGTLDFRDEITYELVEFNGHFRSNLKQVDGDDLYQMDPDSRLLFVCTVRLCTPQLIRDVSLLDSNHNEFTSRHSLEWKFLFLDHRAPPIIGYLPFEVLGTSGYDYYHFDDLENVVTCHEELMQKGELTSCYYRFLTKGQQWIWLQTRFYITYHQWNSKPEFVMCTHRVVSYADVQKNMKQENQEPEVTESSSANHSEIKDNSEDAMAPMSPSYISEASDAYGPYNSRPASVKSASASSTTGTCTLVGTTNTASTSWSRASNARYSGGYENSMASADSRSSQRSSSRDSKEQTSRMEDVRPVNESDYNPNRAMMFQQTPKAAEPTIVPQHGMGAQYLEPAPYVGTVSVPGVLPILPTLPVIVSSDQAQIQEQLQRKHEELQQMIVRQQEELRLVKEQLLLARLGMLQPLINVPNPYSLEDVQQNQRSPAQIMYEETTSRANVTYPPHQQPPSEHQPHQNQHPHQNE